MVARRSQSQTIKPRVFLFGGAKGIGYWFASRVLIGHLNEFDVHLCDVSIPRVPAGSPFGWVPIAYKDGFINNFSEDIGDQDIVIISVPISNIDELLAHLKRHIKGAPQVINFCSVQSTTNEAIVNSLPKNCAVYGLHMLFGPGVSHPAGNNVIVTDLGNNDSRNEVNRFLEIVSESGLFLEYSSSIKHDEMMQVLQVGIHFTFFGFAKYIADKGVEFSDLLKYRTLPAGFFLSFMARALAQPKLTYANIQLQHGANFERQNIVNAFKNLNFELTATTEPKVAEATLRALSDFYKQDDLLEGVAATQVAVQASEISSRQLHEAIKEKSLVGLAVSRQGEEHPEIRVGYVMSELRGYIEFENRLIQLKSPVDGYDFVLFRNDASIACFKNLGLQFRSNRIKLSKKRVSFLTPEYVDQWIRDNTARANTSFPIKFLRFEPEVVRRIEELIPLKVPAVESLQFGKLHIDDQMNVNAVCYVVFDGTISSETVKSKILSALSTVAIESPIASKGYVFAS